MELSDKSYEKSDSTSESVLKYIVHTIEIKCNSRKASDGYDAHISESNSVCDAF